MDNDCMILGKDRYYSLDCYQTKVNNNVLIVGTSGSGKTRSIVTPNLLQACGSYIVSDPKGNLHDKYKDYLESRGYVVRKLDLTNPRESAHYNLFKYIRGYQDCVKVAHMMVYQDTIKRMTDPFWEEASCLLLQSLLGFLYEGKPKWDENFGGIMKLLSYAMVDECNPNAKSRLDVLFDQLRTTEPESFAWKSYAKFRIGAAKTLKSILITLNSRLSAFDTPEMNEMMSSDDIDIASIGQRKTALFVVVSDTDRSMDGLANIFFSQAMNELCSFADKYCADNRLPVPVRFMLDDFATNCKINEFPRMIASIRSRGISVMLFIQAESQLTECYGMDGRTIIGNCDTYVYLGGNDIETARAVAERCDLPMIKVINMPVETNWIFRRGQDPVNGHNFELEPFLKEKLGRQADLSDGGMEDIAFA